MLSEPDYYSMIEGYFRTPWEVAFITWERLSDEILVCVGAVHASKLQCPKQTWHLDGVLVSPTQHHVVSELANEVRVELGLAPLKQQKVGHEPIRNSDPGYIHNCL